MKEKTHDHFFTIVVVRHQGETQFFMADSANNASRLKVYLIRKLLANKKKKDVEQLDNATDKPVFECEST